MVLIYSRTYIVCYITKDFDSEITFTTITFNLISNNSVIETYHNSVALTVTSK